MTEDNELTLALKSLGAGMTSPPQCRVTTEVMPTWRDLRRQRLRWQRGALENVGAYGFTRTTARYWGQQLGLAYGVIALNSYLLLMAIALLAADSFRWSPFWLAIGAIFLLERVVTAWAAGWRGRLRRRPARARARVLAVPAVDVRDVALQIVTRRKAGWNYVPRPALAALALARRSVAAVLGAAWNPLPSSVLQSSLVRGARLFVGVNTLFFATLSVFQMLPPIRKTIHDTRARRAASRPA